MNEIFNEQTLDELDRLLSKYAAAKLADEQAQDASTKARVAAYSAQHERWEVEKELGSHWQAIAAARYDELTNGSTA